jgi:tetratricopeptide (TPR) repeat protein
MSDDIRCPSCGQANPAGSESCSACNFPLHGAPASPTREKPEAKPEAKSEPAAPAPEPRIQRPLPYRPKARGGRAASSQAMTLWLFFGAVAAAIVIFVALQANVQRASVPLEGAGPDLQKQADELRSIIAQDSTNLDARNRYADILYDTANWKDAIVEYRAVVRMDSSRVFALVDLGVCYFNLGEGVEARRLFNLALQRQPGQPVALFNLGIVAENSGDFEAALRYYHDAIRNNPPQNMMQPLSTAIQRVQEKLGRTPPPLDGGGQPGGMPPAGTAPGR